MILNEIASQDSRLFAKSEFGPASDTWPALSFSSHQIATDFANTHTDVITILCSTWAQATQRRLRTRRTGNGSCRCYRLNLVLRSARETWSPRIPRNGRPTGGESGGNGLCRSSPRMTWQASHGHTTRSRSLIGRSATFRAWVGACRCRNQSIACFSVSISNRSNCI